MDGVEAENPPAQLVVAVQGRQPAADGRDQLVVDVERDVVVKQRGLDGAGMGADAGRVHVPLHGAGEGGRQRVGVGLVLRVELMECRAPDVP